MKQIIFFLILTATFGCSSTKIPSEKLSQIEFNSPKIKFESNDLYIELENPVDCPIRIIFESNNINLNTEFERLGSIELLAKSDTLISVLDVPEFDQNTSFKYKWRLGSISKKIEKINLALPFPAGKKHKVIQGNNTNHTHNTDWSRFAVDFDLKINDTICSATSGFVVGVIDKYKFGGIGNEWKPFGNYITIYEPNSGIFTQYVHLTENGSFVKVGDQVKMGQAIGLSGMTGQTDIEHLHFNCLVPSNTEDGLKSIAFEFIGGYKSTELKKGDVIKNN